MMPVDARCLPSQTTTWLTPRWILSALGEFDLDPCCPPVMPWATAGVMISNGEVKRKEDGLWPVIERGTLLQGDGLKMEWNGRVWLNPPYGRGMEEWMEKMASHDDGIALVFARTETNWFQRRIFNSASAILFLDERIRFCRPDGTTGGSPAVGSVLAAYGERCAWKLANSGLMGHLIE